MKNIARLNPSKITENGYYFDIDNGTMFKLSDEEIQAVRNYCHSSAIASKRIIEKKRTSDSRRYKISNNQKYNDNKHRGRNHNAFSKRQIRTILVGTALCLVTVSSVFLVTNTNSNAATGENNVFYYQPLVEERPVSLLQCQVPLIEDNELLEQGSMEIDSNDSLIELSIVEEANAERKMWVQKYCDIYQVDFAITYNRLLELTDNFTSKDYLNGHILGVTCKGEEVYATNEEELILYYVRCVKQIPSQLGISPDGLYITNSYQSSTDYATIIGYYNNLLGADPLLSYAITQSETSWDSDLFLNSNNPAGLRIDGHWWQFSTKEEGFIELALEILKYNRKGAYTIEEIGEIHSKKELGNENWVPNVTAIYNMISENSELLEVLQGKQDDTFIK